VDACFIAEARIKIVLPDQQLHRKLQAVLAYSLSAGYNLSLRKASGQPQDCEPLILYPIAARLGIGDALFLLIANRDSAEESRTTGFAGK
jgi:hypothetical protein